MRKTPSGQHCVADFNSVVRSYRKGCGMKNCEIDTHLAVLFRQWDEATSFMSNTAAVARNPAHTEIALMGSRVIPFVLQRIDDHPHLAMIVLKTLCPSADPVPHEARGKVQQMIECWKDWGRAKGYPVPAYREQP
jgi:hypothetical protein